jgi:hypothetical protein
MSPKAQDAGGALATTIEAPVDREALAILGFTDSADGRQLVSEAKGDLLPYKVPYEAVVDLIEVKAEKNYDSRGIRVKLVVVESDNPQQLRVNQSYTMWFFDRNPSIPAFVLAEMAEQRIRFAATLDEYEGDPLEELPDGTPKFKAAKVLLDLHKQVQPLGIRMRLKNVFVRKTRNGAPLHKLHFELA